MKKENILLWGLVLLFAVLMSVPFLVPHTGLLALIGFVPLLCMERIASQMEKKRIWIYHYSAFVLWNAFTTFWVCNATVGGGLFAIFANAFQMSLIFGLFRISRRKFSGALPYIFLVLIGNFKIQVLIARKAEFHRDTSFCRKSVLTVLIVLTVL